MFVGCMSDDRLQFDVCGVFQGDERSATSDAGVADQQAEGDVPDPSQHLLHAVQRRGTCSGHTTLREGPVSLRFWKPYKMMQAASTLPEYNGAALLLSLPRPHIPHNF